ncbi:MAG: hypothetical protein NXI24_24825 [bacterium]|nr:hypothetical protein [bacterium]
MNNIGTISQVAGMTSGVIQSGAVYNKHGSLTGLDFSSYRGANAAIGLGISVASSELAGSLTHSNENPGGLLKFDTNTLSGAMGQSILSGAISSNMNIVAEYAKMQAWGAENSNFGALSTPGMSNLGGILGMGLSSGITASVQLKYREQQAAKQKALELLARGMENEARDVLAGAGYAAARREDVLNELDGVVRSQKEYFSTMLKKHNDLFKNGHVGDANAIKAGLAAQGFNTDAADNYQAYIRKDFLKNQKQKGYFTAASKAGANGFDEDRGFFYKESANGARTYLIPDGENLRLVSASQLPSTSGPNASHMSGSSATYSGGQLVSIQDPQKFAQWEFAQEVGGKLGLSMSDSNYSNVMSLFGTESNAQAYLRGEEYVDVGLPGGPNAGIENPTYNPWTHAVNTSMSWADNARDRGRQPGYGLWDTLKDTPATIAGGTMELLDAWVVTPARGAADLAMRILYPGMEPGIAKAESEYHVGSRWHQKRLEMMGEIGGTLTAAGGIRMAAGLTGKLGSAARPAAFFDNIAQQATRNPNSSKLVLGHYAVKGQSYQKVAASLKATYYKVEDWNTVTKGLSRDEIWKINEAFLNQQIKQNKRIFFSHDPLKARPGSFFADEVDYLRASGYSFRRVHQWSWEAVR